MIQAVRRDVVVAEDGKIEIHVPEFKPGTRAEVIILERPATESPDVPIVPLASLIGSCKGMFKTAEEADEFLSRERDAWDSPTT